MPELSYGRTANPQKNPSPVGSVSDFKLQNVTIATKTNQGNQPVLKVLRIKLNPYDDSNGLNINQPNQGANYVFDTVEGKYTPQNSYIQPSVSGNFILPHGSTYFDERLTLDYLDRAVRQTEDNAYLTEMFSQLANIASNQAQNEADRTSGIIDTIVRK